MPNKTMTWTRDTFENFKRAYKANSEKESFIFEGNEFVTSYAKYLIEYLETQFNPAA